MKTAPFSCCLTVILAALLACLSANAQEIDPETGFPWGKHNAPTGYISHFEQGTRVRPTRAAMTYAYRLLVREDKASQAEGARVLRNVIKYQDSDPNSRTYGVWPWYIEEPFDEMLAIDYNWADFLGATLISILTNYSDRLPPDVVDEAKASLDRACACIKKRDVQPHYTNIAYMGAVVCAAGGELLGKPEYLEYARMRMERNVNSYKEIGGFTEYNSPTYTRSFWFQARGAIAYWNDSNGKPVCFKQRFLHNDRDFASAAGRSRQTGLRFITAYNMLVDRGSLQPGQDRPKDRTFQVKSFKIVYELIGSKENSVKQLNDNQFEFTSGKIRAVVHLCPENRFEGRQIQWSIQNDPQSGTASLIGVCYEGEEKPFKMDELDEVRIAVGVEFLKDGEAPSTAPVTISDDPYSTKNEGAFYRVQWEPVDTSESPLRAPCKATKY